MFADSDGTTWKCTWILVVLVMYMVSDGTSEQYMWAATVCQGDLCG